MRMPELHCESHNEALGLRVRVKLVDLDNMAGSSSTERVPMERKASVSGIRASKLTVSRSAETRADGPEADAACEICMHSGARIALQDFERHTEECAVCRNRVELQLDFIEAVEGAVLEHRCDPASERIHGALLIDAPELNFAVCGEIEFD